MFSLPFLAYFGTRNALSDYFHLTGFALTAWSVASSVIVVNLIIFAYVWRAFHESTDVENDESLSRENLQEPYIREEEADKKKD